MLLNSEPQRPVQRQFGDHFKRMRDRRRGRDESYNEIGGSEREHQKRVSAGNEANKSTAVIQFDFAALTGHAERPVTLPRCPRR